MRILSMTEIAVGEIIFIIFLLLGFFIFAVIGGYLGKVFDNGLAPKNNYIIGIVSYIIAGALSIFASLNLIGLFIGSLIITVGMVFIAGKIKSNKS